MGVGWVERRELLGRHGCRAWECPQTAATLRLLLPAAALVQYIEGRGGSGAQVDPRLILRAFWCPSLTSHTSQRIWASATKKTSQKPEWQQSGWGGSTSPSWLWRRAHCHSPQLVEHATWVAILAAPRPGGVRRARHLVCHVSQGCHVSQSPSLLALLCRQKLQHGWWHNFVPRPNQRACYGFTRTWKTGCTQLKGLIHQIRTAVNTDGACPAAVCCCHLQGGEST